MGVRGSLRRRDAQMSTAFYFHASAATCSSSVHMIHYERGEESVVCSRASHEASSVGEGHLKKGGAFSQDSHCFRVSSVFRCHECDSERTYDEKKKIRRFYALWTSVHAKVH